MTVRGRHSQAASRRWEKRRPPGDGLLSCSASRQGGRAGATGSVGAQQAVDIAAVGGERRRLVAILQRAAAKIPAEADGEAARTRVEIVDVIIIVGERNADRRGPGLKLCVDAGAHGGRR